jgi:glycosyltransferase involved in cell wall biosynthesis
MKKLAILVTAMLRDNLLEQAVSSILKYRPENTVILIGDQGLKDIDIKKKEHYENLGCYFYTLPFNCGLSWSRNYLVKMAHQMGCEYCVLASDSFVFSPETKNIRNVIPYLESNEFDLIGLFLNRMDIYWVGWIDLLPQKSFVLDFIDRRKDPDVGPIYRCGIVHNFFIAKTDTLMAVKWDETLKLAEHEDFFYRYGQAGYRVGWTRAVRADRIKTREGQHGQFRQENWVRGMEMLRKKWGLQTWIYYINNINGYYESARHNSCR